MSFFHLPKMVTLKKKTLESLFADMSVDIDRYMYVKKDVYQSPYGI